MKEYIKVCNFSFVDKPYTMFIDKKDRYFFMRRDENDNYFYTTYEEQKELLKLFYNPLELMNIKTGEKIKINPKIIMGALLASFTLSMFNGCAKDKVLKTTIENQNVNYYNDKSTIETYTIENDYKEKFEFDYDDSFYDNTKIDTYDEVPGAGNRVHIYDSAFLNEVLEPAKITIDDFYKIIDNNSNITKKFKTIFKDYCYSYVTKCPNADRRILYYNLKNIKINECNSAEMILTTFSTDASACYSFKDNTITVLSEYKYEKGTWEYQILFHELSHAARTAYIEKNGKKYEIKSGGYNYNAFMLDEALNSVFAVRLFDYEETDISYQLQSNYISIIFDSLDNYELSDYINHSQSYFVKKVDDFLGKNDYAGSMFELFQMQYTDFHDDNIKVEQSEYYPLYDFISNIYYKNRLVEGMEYEDALMIKDKLIKRIIFDVSSGYEIDINHFDEYFDEYCNNIGIKVPNKGL